MHWIYLIHEFHNLSWITEINELFHDILIYWDAPVYIYMKCLMKADVWPEDALGLVSVQAQHFLGQARLNPRQLLVRITVLLHRHHFLQRRAEHGGPKDSVTSVSDLLDRGLVQTLQTHREENNSELKSSPCMLGLLSLQTSSYTLSISKWDFSRYNVYVCYYAAKCLAHTNQWTKNLNVQQSY